MALKAGRARNATPSDADHLQIVILDPVEPQDESAPGKARFARILASYGGAMVTATMRLRAAKGEAPTRYGKIIRVHEAIKNYTNHQRGALPDDRALVSFGIDLFETLFQGDVRRLYDEARARHQGRRLNLVLTSMIPWIAEKPWEFAYDPTRKSFLATEEIQFLRNVLTAVPVDRPTPRTGPLRVLVAAAQPVGYGQLSARQELAVMQRGFRSLIAGGWLQVEFVARTTPSMLHTRLSSGDFDVVHFIGHGTYDEVRQQGELVFEDERGRARHLGGRSLREIFCQRGLRLVFLNACQTGANSIAEFNKGVAQSLVAHGLPALVANQYSVLDASATTFAQHFYGAMAQGMSLGQAAREARIAVHYSIQGETIDWAVPVVYARDPNAVLCTPTATHTAGVRRVPSRQSAALHRVGVWDIDHGFPDLHASLERMNAEQAVFQFELVELSPPVDAFDLTHRSRERPLRLNAQRLARRLVRMPEQLGVDILACATRHHLRDPRGASPSRWWPRHRNPPVVVASFGAWPELAAQGTATERAWRSVLVSALAGSMAALRHHDHGAQNCPMAHPPVKLGSGRWQFDAACRAKLVRALPKELPALEALLRSRGSKRSK